jgi:hypothetical protein
MFNQISWAIYLKVVCILLFIYYLVVIIKFFSKELLSFFTPASDVSGNTLSREHEINQKEHDPGDQSYPDLFQPHNKYTASKQEVDDTFQQVEKLTTALKEVIADGALNSMIKEELMLSLRFVLEKYHYLKDSPFLIAINNLIASECDKYKLIHLNVEELAMLWD